MFERFTDRARQVVVVAEQEARAAALASIEPRHLLLGLVRVEDGVAARALDALDVTLERVQANVHRVRGSGEERTVLGQLPFASASRDVLEAAHAEADACGQEHVGTEHILLALARADEAGIVGWPFFLSVDVVRKAVLRLIAEGADDRTPGRTPGSLRGAPRSARARPSVLGDVIQALERAGAAADRDGARDVDAGDILLALAVDANSLTGIALARLGVDFTSLRGAIEAVRDLDRQLAVAHSATQAALAAERFDQIGELRDAERALANRRRELRAPTTRR